MKQTIEKDIKFSRLSENENYYIYIFKKTEKIIAAVFYILNHVPQNSINDSLLQDLTKAARDLHAISLDSLHHFEHAADEILMKFSHALIALESTARLCAASGVISQDLMHVLGSEIDAVHRGIQNRYMAPGTKVVFGEPGEVSSGTTGGTAVRTTSQRTSSVGSASSTRATETTTARDKGNVGVLEGPDRRERIKTVLEARGESTIKDISAVITDVSEKTIQRELNAMIEDNVIRRIGERRWSRYTLH